MRPAPREQRRSGDQCERGAQHGGEPEQAGVLGRRLARDGRHGRGARWRRRSRPLPGCLPQDHLAWPAADLHDDIAGREAGGIAVFRCEAEIAAQRVRARRAPGEPEGERRDPRVTSPGGSGHAASGPRLRGRRARCDPRPPSMASARARSVSGLGSPRRPRRPRAVEARAQVRAKVEQRRAVGSRRSWRRRAARARAGRGPGAVARSGRTTPESACPMRRASGGPRRTTPNMSAAASAIAAASSAMVSTLACARSRMPPRWGRGL